MGTPTENSVAEALSADVQAAIIAYVKQDGAPNLLRLIQQACKEEEDRHLKDWHAKDSPLDAIDSYEDECPKWVWWTIFCGRFDWFIEGLERAIEERGMTRKQIDKKHAAEELERKRRELGELEKRVKA